MLNNVRQGDNREDLCGESVRMAELIGEMARELRKYQWQPISSFVCDAQITIFWLEILPECKNAKFVGQKNLIYTGIYGQWPSTYHATHFISLPEAPTPQEDA